MSRTPIGVQLLQLALERVAQTGDQLDHGTRRLFAEAGLPVPASTRGEQFSVALRELIAKLDGQGGLDRFVESFRRTPPASPAALLKKK